MAAGQALGVDLVGEVEVADVADDLDVIEGQGDDVAAEVEQIDQAGADKAGGGEVAGKDVAEEAADENFFSRVGWGAGHGLQTAPPCRLRRRQGWRTRHCRTARATGHEKGANSAGRAVCVMLKWSVAPSC